MIVRVFRATVPRELHAEFEAKFSTLSVRVVHEQSGFHSVTIGRPTRWKPDEFVMISKWADERALEAFVGPEWNEPHIPEEMAPFITTCSVDHYEVVPID